MALQVRDTTAYLPEKLSKLTSGFDAGRVSDALAVAQAAYGETVYWTGETLLDHAFGVLDVLVPFEPDEDTVIACLLHHILEHKSMSLLELEQRFGSKVRALVSGIHLLSHVTLEGRRRSIDDLRLMLLSVSDDIRVVLVCLSDRCHCLRFVGRMNAERSRRLCQDVLQLFASVAARLGIYSLKHELESRAFPVVYPSDAERISEQLALVHGEHPDFLEDVASMLQRFLAEQGITARVEAREKQMYSVFQKMRKKSLTSVRDIHDLFALRVIVDSNEDCYRVLGVLHQVGRPMDNRFKDYIAFPKPNGYQSLHTTLAAVKGVPAGMFVEVQVRTTAMHRGAQFGIAAHWSYKEHGATRRALESVQLQAMLVGQESVGEGMTEQSFADHIFVLTPRGDIVELPESATPLDFAFQVHTDLGLSFRGALVNGSIVPLDYELQNGDVVEIQKHAVPKPSPHWMQLLKMGSSRSKLKTYLYAQERPRYVARGRELVNEELRKKGIAPLTTDLSVLRVCDGESLTMEQREDILMKIGQGSERAGSLLPRLAALKAHGLSASNVQLHLRLPGDISSQKEIVGIEGNLAMPVKFARCCNPKEWPRESIVGNISRAGAVMVHRSACRMFNNTNPERRVGVWWR
ncbi:bifunctional (p)ppGpp synthetase/guanosine-3',5'-bis(diphosphate) 3'-pyrophosphohydrolase [Candidatus Peregrinibacteria bacterium]|nr:bifunctional (p)ppGpp synthetase/guanosine-3',5'-bis(diphosphate) 3'-pyrophosphohydrolase [Candidatus Peregrinibacteria bacterium]